MRVRFAPSPTGYLHIGGARTALFNWLLARKAGGVFILRIEDTDQGRNVEDSVGKILEDFRWLGLPWDEGPEVGGPVAPYFQSRRLNHYDHFAKLLLQYGQAYFALETTQELTAMREKAIAATGGFRYPRPDPLPTVEEGLAARAAGRPAVVRFKMPGTDIRVVDDILGGVVMPAAELEDFVILKSDGFPTYHFACVVDDHLMGITHILRGQEHLMNTPKHVAMQQALGFATPYYAHLPVIFNMNGAKMSKRDKEKAIKRGERPPEIEVHDFRVSGYLPEAILNFIALVGWNPGDEREYFTLDELVEVFRVERVNKTNGRFDREKLLAFNTHWCAKVTPERLLEAFKDYLSVNQSALLRLGDAGLAHILECKKGFRTFRELEETVLFLITPDDAIGYDEKAVGKVLEKNEGKGFDMLARFLPRLQSQMDWSAAAMHALLDAFCRENDAKLGDVAQPLRVAITGTTISPPIHDSLALLGRAATLARIQRCLSQRPLAGQT